MSYIFVVMGKSASGKDTIYKRLANEMNLQTIISYTTRPIRDGEKEGVEYYFVDESQYHQLLEENRVIEHRTYDTIYGQWTYFTVDDEQIKLNEKNYLMIGTLESYKQIKQYYGEEIVRPIYIEVENGLRLERALSRERQQSIPKYEEMCRRFLADQKDFSQEKIKELNINKHYENINLEQCMNEIENDLIYFGITKR